MAQFAEFTWFDGYPPPDLEITQVYGLLFTDCGRLLLFINDDHYSLPGGGPEAHDGGLVGTLRREALEEVNTEIHEPVIVGYQTMEGENFAQVRMTAMIKEIKPVRPDPDSGRTYKRVLATPARAIELLGWHDTGASTVNAAVKIARELFGADVRKCTKCFGEPGEENEQIFI